MGLSVDLTVALSIIGSIRLAQQQPWPQSSQRERDVAELPPGSKALTWLLLSAAANKHGARSEGELY